MFLSHPHADHINGLLGVIGRYEVGSIVMSGVKYQYAGYDKFYRLAAERGVPIIFVDGSFDLRLGKIGFDLIYPERSLQGISFDNVNNSSVVFRLIYWGKSRVFLRRSGRSERGRAGQTSRSNSARKGLAASACRYTQGRTSRLEDKQ